MPRPFIFNRLLDINATMFAIHTVTAINLWNLIYLNIPANRDRWGGPNFQIDISRAAPICLMGHGRKSYNWISRKDWG